jgi:hypothetical protein
LGTVNAFMVREEDGGEAQLAAAASHVEGRHATVKGGGAVQMQVHPNPGAPCASGHVRYYRWREGSGKGSRQEAPVRGGG